jgi:hypothetical protein
MGRTRVLRHPRHDLGFPEVVDIELGVAKGFESGDRKEDALVIVAEQFGRLAELQDELIQRRVALF